MEKLKRCPFCGSEKLKIDKKSKLYAHAAVGRIEQHTFSVRCNVCHARGGAVGGKVADGFCGKISKVQITTDDEIKAAAIAAWNNRKPVDDVLERLEEELNFADTEKKRCAKENLLQFDSAKGCAQGLYNAIEIIKEELGGLANV